MGTADVPAEEDNGRQDAARLLAERQRTIANAFVVACAAGDVGGFNKAADFLNSTVNGWKLAFRLLAKLRLVGQEIKDAFLPIWVSQKTLPRRIDDRSATAAGLRLLMPGYSGPTMELYRGTVMRPGRGRVPGFSWTSRFDIARQFAANCYQAALDLRESGHAGPPDFTGVVLRTLAPPETIFLVRETGDGVDEGEVMVDPFRLGAITVAERLPA